MSELCAWCDAPKTAATICPACGADYAKAEAIKKHGSARTVVQPRQEYDNPATLAKADSEPAIPIQDPESEWRNCQLALPLMLLGAWLCQVFNVFDALQRIVFGMPVHEVGHALTAWLTGHNAIPTLWETRVDPERGIFAPLLLAGIYLAIIRYAMRRKQHFLLVPVGILVLLQLYGTFFINQATAEMWITWGGDGIGLVLATCLMCTFYLGKETQLYKGSVRWGLLFWGAAAFMDIFMAWWEGQADLSRVGYGKSGHNLTDAYLLMNAYSWNQQGMFNSYLYTAFGCLLFLVVVYVLGLKQAQGWKNEQSRINRLAAIRGRTETS
jgi:hypothetical protein